MQFNKIIRKEDTKSPGASPVIVLYKKDRLQVNLLYRGANSSDLKKEH